MKNVTFTLFLLMFLPIISFSQNQFKLDLSFQNKNSRKAIVNEKLESVQAIDQIDALENWISDKKESFTLRLTDNNQDYVYKMKRTRFAERVEVKIGEEAPSVQSFLTYYGFADGDSENAISILLSEDHGFYFSQENQGYEYAILKSYSSGRSQPDYNVSLSKLSSPRDKKCSLDHKHVSQGEEVIGSRNSNFDHTEYLVQLGAAADFEFLASRGGSTALVVFLITSRAGGAAALYGSCDMRVILSLISVVIETTDDDFFPTPWCLFGRTTTDGYAYNQVFKNSSAKPDGDVVTLWTGTDLRGYACVNEISGMANLIGGVCRNRNTNVAESTGGAFLQAHEIGHNLGIGVNHGNISGNYFYNNSTPVWHTNTISTIHQKLNDKSCVDKIETCCISIDDVYLCEGETDFCIDLPACANGSFDLSNHNDLFINGSGQLCGSIESSFKVYTIKQVTPGLGCFVNSVSFKVTQCEGSTPFYSEPPSGLHEICIDDLEEYCYQFDCVASWAMQGSPGGLFVNSEGSELCISSRGLGHPGPTTITLQPTFVCGSTGPWVTWTIILKDCTGFGDTGDMNTEKQNPVHNESKSNLSIRNNTLFISNKYLDESTTLDLYTIDGKLINSRQNFGDFEYDLSSLASGLYIAVIRQGEHVEAKKIFRE